MGRIALTLLFSVTNWLEMVPQELCFTLVRVLQSYDLNHFQEVFVQLSVKLTQVPEIARYHGYYKEIHP